MAMAAGDPCRDDAVPADEAGAAAVRVRRYLRFLGCARGELDDLVQETMLAAVGAFARQAPPLPWLLTAARNALRQHFRRRGRRREVADLDRLHARWIEEARSDGGDAQREALRECLRGLPERSRQVVQLRYGDGLRRATIARRLGLLPEGVKSLLARVRAALGDCIRRRLGDEA
jgi:RNA polymerase sigma-70 factor (ECF subfamily)